VTVSTFFTHADGNIQLLLKDPSNTTIDVGNSATDDETVGPYVAPVDGEYLVRVWLASETDPFAGNDYDLDIDVVATAACSPDAFEDNDTWGTPTPVTSGNYPGLTACPSDSDWYVFDMAAGDELNAAILFAHAQGDIKYQLRDPSNATVAIGNSTTDDEYVQSYFAATSGEYRLLIWLVSESDGVPGNDYELDLEITSGVGCLPDSFEDNDYQAAAAPVTSGEYTGLSACPSDADWYSVDMTSGDELNTAVFFAHADGDVQMRLMDPSGAQVAISNSATDDEFVGPFFATASGEHRIHVWLASETDPVEGNDYTLYVDLTSTATCVDDSYEENDDAAGGAPVGDGNYPGLAACPTDPDWFLVDLDVGDELTVDVLFAHADGDIDLELRGPAGALLDSSTSTTDEESVGPWTAAVAGAHQVQVWLDSETDAVPGADYEMDVYVVPFVTTPCTDDAEEDNDDPSAATVFTGPGVLTGLIACDSDLDWYAVDLLAGEVASFDAFFSHAEGDIDLELYDSAATLADSSTSVTDDERVNFVAVTDETIFLQVELVNDLGVVPGNTYELELNVGLATTCVPDTEEPNDSSATATVLPSTGDLVTGLTACDTDDDWYAIDLTSGDTLDVDVLFTDAEGDIDVELYDPSGTLVASGYSADDNETLAWPVSADGTYEIVVWLALDDGILPGNAYSLDVQVSTGPPPTCTDDWLEDDDTPPTANPVVAPWSDLGLAACPGDDDWFAVDLLTGEEVTVNLAFTHAEGDVDLELYDDTATVVDSSTSLGDGESVTYTATGDGSYFARVFLATDLGGTPGNNYDINVEVVAPVCTDDFLEDNDDYASAMPIPAALLPGLNACPADDDFFIIDLLTGDALDVDLLFSHAEGDIDVYLRDPSAAAVASGTSSDDNESLSWTATADGDHVLEIYLAIDSGAVPGNAYDMLAILDPLVPPCSPGDWFEPNDTQATASPILPPATTGLGACPTDDDWFAFDAPDAATIDISAIFADAEGDVDIELYDSSGTWLDGSYTATDDEQLTYVTTAADTYYLMVTLYLDDGPETGNTYELTFDLL